MLNALSNRRISVRVFKSVAEVRLRGLFKWFDHMKRRAFIKEISPIGENPFDFTVTYRTTCGLSDSDYNGHLSNSAYAKVLLTFLTPGWGPIGVILVHLPLFRRTLTMRVCEPRSPASLPFWKLKAGSVWVRLTSTTSKRSRSGRNTKSASILLDGARSGSISSCNLSRIRMVVKRATALHLPWSARRRKFRRLSCLPQPLRLMR